MRAAMMLRYHNGKALQITTTRAMSSITNSAAVAPSADKVSLVQGASRGENVV
jgi:hypothetical protein